MKLVVVVLLFASATADLHNWVGLPDTRFEQVDQLMQDEPFVAKRIVNPATADLANLFDSTEMNDPAEYEGSGINPGSEINPIKEIVESLHDIIPAIKELKEARDKQNHEYAEQFVYALKHADDDEDLKKVLGFHMVMLHKRCLDIKLAFARHVHKEGLLDKIKNDDLDLTEIMGKVIAAAEHQQFDVFDVFVHLVRKSNLHGHPAAQVIIAIGGMVAEAACEVNMDGLIKRIAEMIEKEDKEGDFDLSDKVLPFLYEKNSKKCPGNLIQSLEPHKSIKARLLGIIFENCKEVKFVRFAVSTVLDAIKLGKKVEIMKKMDMKRLHEMLKDVTSLMKSNLTDEAHIVVGDYVLTDMRRALLVGLAVHKQLAPSGPKPSGSPRPFTGPKPSGSPRPFTGPKPSASPSPFTGPKPSGSPMPSTGPKPSASPSPFTGPKPDGTTKPDELKRTADFLEGESIDLFQ
ncbi:hypothetical protein OS493_037601 [Desmophyllum pertusum]|uniref:Uncharacterized protein n=1 Tax=Desmophyllum pertusum TaxID=174260 RepID=A0A9X0D863_9CNID|nr:hypothetical protein OS493_037601 [Desmophyllum pertusum]